MVITMLRWVGWFFSDDPIARWIGLVIWTVISAMLTYPARRRLFGQPEYVDDLLFAAWLLTLNRVCYSVQALFHNDTFADVNHWTGIVGGLFYAYVVSGYIWPNGKIREIAARVLAWFARMHRA